MTRNIDNVFVPPAGVAVKVSLATVIFVASQTSLSAEVKLVIKQQLQKVANGWTVYRIARQASRMVKTQPRRFLNQGWLASNSPCAWAIVPIGLNWLNEFYFD